MVIVSHGTQDPGDRRGGGYGIAVVELSLCQNSSAGLFTVCGIASAETAKAVSCEPRILSDHTLALTNNVRCLNVIPVYHIHRPVTQ